MVKLAEKQRTYDRAVRIFVNTYDKKEFIAIEFDDTRPDYVGKLAIENDDHVLIVNYDFLLKVLQMFGHVMKKLFISFAYMSESKETMKIIHEIIANPSVPSRLSKLTLDACKGNELKKIEYPFGSVEILSISGGPFKNLNSKSHLNFSEIFPGIQHLKIGQIEVIDDQSIVLKYPNLEHLQLNSFDEKTSTNTFTQKQIKKTLKLNPLINNLSLTGIKKTFLKEVNEILPKLTDFEIEYWIDDDENEENFKEVSFKNVKSLGIKSKHSTPLSNVLFPKLEEITIDLPTKSLSNWNEWFKQKHPNVRKFNFKSSFSSNLPISFARFAEIWPKLTIVSAESESIAENDILEFLFHSEELEILTLTKINEEKVNYIRQHLTSDWIFEFIDEKHRNAGIILRRKEPFNFF